jgi:DNA-binding transcriptional LysR family regulator
MRASLPQLESFYWVARLGSFHAAARRQNLTQPTISARIRELEASLGIKLFERSNRRAEITAIGYSILAQTEQMLRTADEIDKQIYRRDPMRGLLRLGSVESAALSGLTEMLTQLAATYPQLKIEVTVEVGAAIAEKLVSRQLDIAMSSDPGFAPHVVSECIGRMKMSWVAAGAADLPDSGLAPADLSRQHIITIGQPSVLHSVVTDWLARERISNISFCNSHALIIQLVRAAHGIAILPVALVRNDLASGAIKLLKTRPPVARQRFYVSYLRDRKGQGTSTLVAMAQRILTRNGLLEATKA